jgi:hypothetical protein
MRQPTIAQVSIDSTPHEQTPAVSTEPPSIETTSKLTLSNTSTTSIEATGISNETVAKSYRSKSPKFLRLDEAAPTVKYAKTHFLHSIPLTMRLSIEAALNKTVMYQDPFLQRRRYVFEFNPSIIRLPEHQKTSKEAVYLASYRISTQHACFHQQRNEIRHTNYIGFAVLDAQLQILQETTLNPYEPLQRFEDFRLFVLNDELYVASFTSLHRFWIVPPTEKSGFGPVISLTGKSPSNLTVTIERTGRCSRDPSVHRAGKSLVYFTNPEGKVLMEPFPMKTKEVIPEVSCEYRNESLVTESVHMTLPLPAPSFNTTDQLYFQEPHLRKPAITGDRGSYCCATIEHGGRSYLLGVSHLKTRYFNTPAPNNPAPNQYFSRFYAMDTLPPYNVVAQSGKFCLGWNVSEHPVWYYANLTSGRRLKLGNETMNCPGIHFVSGMTDAVDPTQLIIGYGVNDCFARFAIVAKAEVAQMLFGWSN